MDKENIAACFFWAKFISIAILLVIACVWSIGAGSRIYDVWAQRKEGEAELAKATANRQIAIQEALAKQESAKHLAEAEVARAEGVARANKIIGDSLQNNEAYLRYLWIDGLHSGKNEVIYVPTEANLPILEAGKR
jgi:hypothetical protein